jgi:hypothetical protein
MRRCAVLFALWLAAACSRDRGSRSAPEPPPPDLALGTSGGSKRLSASALFSFVPEDARVVGIADPSRILGDKVWRARHPRLTAEAARLRTAEFDPSRHRLLFFASPAAGGTMSVAVVAEGRLAGVAGGRRESLHGVEVHRFDGAGTGLAFAAGATVVGREPALGRALDAGIRRVGRLASSPGFAEWSELWERLPAEPTLAVVTHATPALSTALDRAALGLPPALAAFLRAARDARALAAAIHGHGASLHLALVARMASEGASRGAGEAARRAAAGLRLPPGEIPREPAEILLDAALSRLRVRERGPFLFVEASIPAELLVRLSAR